MSASKARGTRAESAVVAYLRSIVPAVERRAMSGAVDKGDIAGIPGVVVEVKDHVKLDLAGWVSEMLAEMSNAGADVGVVWHKRRGKGSPADWYVTTTGDVFSVMLAAWLRDAATLDGKGP